MKVMSLKQARAAAAELKLFLEENKCKSQDDLKKVCAELSRMTVTARHVCECVLRACAGQAGPGLVNLYH